MDAKAHIQGRLTSFLLSSLEGLEEISSEFEFSEEDELEDEFEFEDELEVVPLESEQETISSEKVTSPKRKTRFFID